jgi:hypothetical protein
MRLVRIPEYIPIGLSIVALVAATPAVAQLGATKQAGNGSLGDVVHRAQGGSLVFHETTDANGIVVRQYVDSSGKVYAVTWRGPAMPDIPTLLGTYFATFRDGASASIGTAGLHAARVSDGDLVVENQVRLREFSGRAWLVSALPPGTSTTDIQ